MSDEEFNGHGLKGASSDSDDFDENCEDIIIVEDEPVEEEKKDAEGNIGTRRGMYKIPDAERVTSRFMTKYERARILGCRAHQISKNAPLLVDPEEESHPYKLAEMELDKSKIPFIVRRYLPDGSYEDWKASELFIE